MYRFKNTLHNYRLPYNYSDLEILLYSSNRRQFIGLITYKIHFYIYYFKSSVECKKCQEIKAIVACFFKE